MIQFYTIPSERYSMAEEAQMAVEGGCRWINLCSDGTTAMQLKEEAGEIIPVCREADAFLVIDNDVELVKELRVHGVRLTDGRVSAAQARELLGPHAIIGVHVASPAEVSALKGVDVDYVTVCIDRLDGVAQVAAAMELPVVAVGEGVSLESMEALVSGGAHGIGISNAALDSDDPVAYIADVMAKAPRR